jgi:hypothetical protein
MTSGTPCPPKVPFMLELHLNSTCPPTPLPFITRFINTQYSSPSSLFPLPYSTAQHSALCNSSSPQFSDLGPLAPPRYPFHLIYRHPSPTSYFTPPPPISNLTCLPTLSASPPPDNSSSPPLSASYPVVYARCEDCLSSSLALQRDRRRRRVRKCQ